MSPEKRAQRPPLALIAGPTASGKSDLAVRLALALGAEGRMAVIVNADSAQVYRDLAIVSARPTPAEMRGIDHRLFGEWDGAEACSAADWADRARAAIDTAHGRGAVPILVGGTGLYLRTLLDGIAPVPPIDPEVRSIVRSMSATDAHAALSAEDPAAAARLSPNDSARTARALEVVRSTGRTLASWQGQRTGGIGHAVDVHAAILLPVRETLYDRCDRRFDHMLERGALAEVEALLARALDPALPVMRAIGVPELASHLRGEASLDEARARATQATRNYAKRQYTWFRHQPPDDWARIHAESYDFRDIFATLFQH
jgi:tRNA dimethylallyltransferase